MLVDHEKDFEYHTAEKVGSYICPLQLEPKYSIVIGGLSADCARIDCCLRLVLLLSH